MCQSTMFGGKRYCDDNLWLGELVGFCVSNSTSVENCIVAKVVFGAGISYIELSLFLQISAVVISVLVAEMRKMMVRLEYFCLSQ
mmetsp:Transcript_19979/g.30796  ORF Transcript_19979/g.30796 Transcript_19979/m.30796 type:complete len:85 (-) Transcript_19979:334-588(-)